MRRSVIKSRARNARNELVLLLIASMAVAAALTFALTRGGGTPENAIGTERLLLIVMVTVAALLASVLVWRSVTVAKHLSRRARRETAELRRSLAVAEAVIKAEPQVLIFWDQDHETRLVAKTLDIPGLPQTRDEILSFSAWLDPRSSATLTAGLDTLFREGQSFNVILRTTGGAHLEAEGRASSGSAVLRLRDIAGYKRDLATIIDQHAWLARDIGAMRSLLNALPMPVWLKTRDGRLSWVNDAYVKAVESEDEAEVLSRQIELMDTRDRKKALRAIARGEAFRERIRIVVGKERKAHDIVMLPLDETIAAAALDATAQESAEGELARQITAYDRTLDHVATGVAMFDRDLNLTFFNEAFRALWHLDADWLGSHPSAGSLLDRLRERGLLPETANYREFKAKVLAPQTSGAEFEDWWLLPDGRIIHVVADQRPDGGVAYVFSDDSERLAMESRYNALINVQRETLDSLKEGVAVFATDGRLKLHNSAFAQIWKLSRDMLGEFPFIDEIIDQATALSGEGDAWPRIRQVATAFFDVRPQVAGQMLRSDNSVIDYATTPLPDGATLVTFVDVTDSKRYERALLERNEALEVADRLKNQFISHISYELRTPLTTIIGFSDMLANAYVGPLNSKQREYVEDIGSSSKTLLAIIDDILDLATIDAGALDLKLAEVDVEAVINSAIMGVRDRAARAGLTIDIGIEQDVASFLADEQRVRQVLYNVLSNAVGFSREGGTVRVTCWRDRDATVFEIEDEGVGIPFEEQARVFDRFVSRSQGSKHRGTGLGLSISRSLVELHGGSLNLTSEPGRGTRVTVRFPLQPASGDQAFGAADDGNTRLHDAGGLQAS